MTLPLSPARRRLRWISLGTILLLLFWLPIEDMHLSWVILFAGGLCALAAASLSTLLPFDRLRSASPGLYYPIAGLAAGLAVAPVALLLMAFKSGLHGHPLPDFTPAQVTSILRSAPLWTLAGLLTGLGLYFLARR